MCASLILYLPSSRGQNQSCYDLDTTEVTLSVFFVRIYFIRISRLKFEKI